MFENVYSKRLFDLYTFCRRTLVGGVHTNKHKMIVIFCGIDWVALGVCMSASTFASMQASKHLRWYTLAHNYAQNRTTIQ